ncbi:hypothetical protein HYW55_01035 [Candidatus Gottesmanbacteria bacterium]|nr:hypothetical protein [Candidatus Gottesmanbacteria bacterium]
MKGYQLALRRIFWSQRPIALFWLLVAILGMTLVWLAVFDFTSSNSVWSVATEEDGTVVALGMDDGVQLLSINAPDVVVKKAYIALGNRVNSMLLKDHILYVAAGNMVHTVDVFDLDRPQRTDYWSAGDAQISKILVQGCHAFVLHPKDIGDVNLCSTVTKPVIKTADRILDFAVSGDVLYFVAGDGYELGSVNLLSGNVSWFHVGEKGKGSRFFAIAADPNKNVLYATSIQMPVVRGNHYTRLHAWSLFDQQQPRPIEEGSAIVGPCCTGRIEVRESKLYIADPFGSADVFDVSAVAEQGLRSMKHLNWGGLSSTGVDDIHPLIQFVPFQDGTLGLGAGGRDGLLIAKPKPTSTGSGLFDRTLYRP